MLAVCERDRASPTPALLQSVDSENSKKKQKKTKTFSVTGSVLCSRAFFIKKAYSIYLDNICANSSVGGTFFHSLTFASSSQR